MGKRSSLRKWHDWHPPFAKIFILKHDLKETFTVKMHPSVSSRVSVCHAHTRTRTLRAIIPQTEAPSVQCSQLPFVSCVLANFTEFYQSMQDRPSVAPHQTIHFTQTTSPACPAAGSYVQCVYIYTARVYVCAHVNTRVRIKDKDRRSERDAGMDVTCRTDTASESESERGRRGGREGRRRRKPLYWNFKSIMGTTGDPLHLHPSPPDSSASSNLIGCNWNVEKASPWHQ